MSQSHWWQGKNSNMLYLKLSWFIRHDTRVVVLACQECLHHIQYTISLAIRWPVVDENSTRWIPTWHQELFNGAIKVGLLPSKRSHISLSWPYMTVDWDLWHMTVAWDLCAWLLTRIGNVFLHTHQEAGFLLTLRSKCLRRSEAAPWSLCWVGRSCDVLWRS